MTQTLFDGICMVSFFTLGTVVLLVAGEIAQKLYDRFISSIKNNRRQKHAYESNEFLYISSRLRQPAGN